MPTSEAQNAKQQLEKLKKRWKSLHGKVIQIIKEVDECIESKNSTLLELWMKQLNSMESDLQTIQQ